MVTNSVDPAKDVDGLHFENAGKLITGLRDDAFVPCTVFFVYLYLIGNLILFRFSFNLISTQISSKKPQLFLLLLRSNLFSSFVFVEYYKLN